MAEQVLDVEDILSARSPFQELPPEHIRRLATAATVRQARPGELIAEYGHNTTEPVWVVVSGRVELTGSGGPDGPDDYFDEVGAGGLFGYMPLLIGPQARFVARAAETSRLIGLPADQMRPVFDHHAGMAYVAETAWQSISATRQRQSSSAWSAKQRVGELLREDPLFVEATMSVADAAHAMGRAGQSCALIALPDGELGILTESDITHRVVGAGLPTSVAVHSAMSYPTRSVSPDRFAVTVWLEMLDAGVRHMPVRIGGGRVVGVLQETDLLVAGSRGGSLQRAVSTATDPADLQRATLALPRLAGDLFSSGVDAESTCGVLSLVIDAATRRAIELAGLDETRDSETGRGEGGFAWMTLGSVARREAMPSSDVDSALSWYDDLDAQAPQFRGMASRVHTLLDACGLPADSNGAVASSPRFSRSVGAWRSAAVGWLDAPLKDRGLIMSSLLIDGRVIVGRHALHSAPSVYGSMPAEHPEALRLQLLNALSVKPRVRSIRDVVSRRGGTFDLKMHLVTPIVNLARWAGLTAGVTTSPTPARLRRAVEVGTINQSDAALLEDVFAMVQRLRLRHQIEQVGAGHTPGDVIVMADLSPLERSTLAEAVREVVNVQRRISHLTSLRGTSSDSTNSDSTNLGGRTPGASGW